jgi:drug/metabolite transporter (DMT)-like permease
MRSSPLGSDLLLLLTAAIWGFAFVAQRMGMEHVGPFTFNGLRFALGCLSLLPLLAVGRRFSRPVAVPVRSRLFLLGGGALGVVLSVAVSLQQVALLYTTAGKAGFITGLYVVMVPILGLLWNQRPGAGTWIGAALAAAGLYLLSVTEDFSIATGDGLVLVSAVFWSVQVLLVAYLSPRTRPVELAFFQFFICALLSLAAAWVFESFEWTAIAAAAGPIAYGGVLSVGVAYTLQVVAQRRARPAHASILMSLEAVFAAVGGWWILDEGLNLRALVGCGFMLGGMLLSQLWALRK